MTDQFWLWLGFACMALGAAAILVKGGRKTHQEEIATILHGTVPIIAACSYFAMAVGQGSILLHTNAGGGPGGPSGGHDYVFYFARYIDWMFTTPLLLTALSLTAMHAKVRRPGLLLGVVVADVLMIVTALFFGLSGEAWIKWTWFLISCGAFLAVYYVIWVGLREESEQQETDVAATFKRNASILSVIWLIYPIVLLFDPEGLGVLGSTATVAIIAVIDVTAKVVYGYFSTVEHAATAKREARAGTLFTTNVSVPAE